MNNIEKTKLGLLDNIIKFVANYSISQKPKNCRYPH